VTTDRDAAHVVRSFFDAVGALDGEPGAAFRAWLAPGCIWQNSGAPTCHGVDACVALLDGARSSIGFHTWVVEYRGVATDADLVLTERLDRLVDVDGVEVTTIPVMGALRVEDGQIVEWRDYFWPEDARPRGNGAESDH
jgi:limonene-1,2-epoxide hydrolase